MVELGTTASRIQQQYEAIMSLHTVAALSLDNESATKYRNDLHSLLDHMLDQGQLLGQLQKKMDEIKKKALGL
jgi:hypothetical protein